MKIISTLNKIDKINVMSALGSWSTHLYNLFPVEVKYEIQLIQAFKQSDFTDSSC